MSRLGLRERREVNTHQNQPNTTHPTTTSRLAPINLLVHDAELSVYTPSSTLCAITSSQPPAPSHTIMARTLSRPHDSGADSGTEAFHPSPATQFASFPPLAVPYLPLLPSWHLLGVGGTTHLPTKLSHRVAVMDGLCYAMMFYPRALVYARRRRVGR